MMIFVCYPRCTTCQKARRWLDENGFLYEARDIKIEHPSQEEIMGWSARSGLPLKRFFNTRGQIYRDMGLKDKLPAMSDDEQIALLASDGMLIRRPILVDDHFVLVGFKPNEWARKLKE